MKLNIDTGPLLSAEFVHFDDIDWKYSKLVPSKDIMEDVEESINRLEKDGYAGLIVLNFGETLVDYWLTRTGRVEEEVAEYLRKKWVG